ncbi:ABC transporter ATP-binding protein [filamentous cyanobacterium CCP1]|nr:ABC transporter ATP-binding protein [filamentous cyanobacterium CCP2]PSB61603.1 ABC transporter ATP-binding protein [filamentous cyanobacterium CCP1]
MKRTIEAIKTLLPLLQIYPWAIPVIIAIGVLSSFCEGFGISLFIPLFQNIEQSTSPETNNFFLRFLNYFSLQEFSSEHRLLIIAAFIFGCILLKNGLTYSNEVLFAWLNSRISHRLRAGIFQQLLSVSYSFWESNESGKLMNTLATETWATSRALGVLVGLIINTCTVVVFVLLLLLLSWRLTLVVGVAVVCISFFIQWVTRRVKTLGQQTVEINQVLANRMWESFGAMKLIRAFGRERYEQNRFEDASLQVQNIFLKLDILSGLVNPISEVLSAALLLCILAVVLFQSRSSLPTLLTFVFILYRLQPKIKLLDSARVSLVRLSSSVEDVIALLDSSNKPYIRSGQMPFQTLRQAIKLESITFAYHPEATPALQNVSVSIPAGRTTALVGPSGAGKSSLIGLIFRFYDPVKGAIYVDDCPLCELDLQTWRDRMAIVSQDIYIFNASIRENIAYGRLDAMDSEIIEAAKLANAHDFICQLPHGYETQVGSQGMRLSGGQRQRIALARAIVRDPDILILDEATNALDSIAENLIQDALNTLSRDRTVIIIAHRLSTIEHAEQIIVLENGKIVEHGDLQSLLKQDGLFAKMYSLQNRQVSIT